MLFNGDALSRDECPPRRTAALRRPAGREVSRARVFPTLQQQNDFAKPKALNYMVHNLSNSLTWRRVLKMEKSTSQSTIAIRVCFFSCNCP